MNEASSSSRPAKPGDKRKIPLGPIGIGIVGGGLLGALLAWGIIAIVQSNRLAAQRAETEAIEAEAVRLGELEKARREGEANSEWRRWATQERAP
ncbi:MAG: hypothetical protein C0483_11515 [Pirellula sp.]|nr:hypothetical protein [Pirellula sp.]